ncbi:hypothetical protein BaRGS_00036410 [Batillaria attramentaria]|uniref:Uncharacterized protein n=1 Tax=Batillaria attramentaria TaxID=370345 RepID=A0ABD0JC30_9CAEN
MAHDWLVTRRTSRGKCKNVAFLEPTGMTAFSSSLEFAAEIYGKSMVLRSECRRHYTSTGQRHYEGKGADDDHGKGGDKCGADCGD